MYSLFLLFFTGILIVVSKSFGRARVMASTDFNEYDFMNVYNFDGVVISVLNFLLLLFV